MAPKLLTDRFLRSVAAPANKAFIEFGDTACPGLRVRVGKRGPVFYAVVGKGRRKIKLGAYPSVALADARERAIEAITDKMDGRPGATSAPRNQRLGTVQELFEYG